MSQIFENYLRENVFFGNTMTVTNNKVRRRRKSSSTSSEEALVAKPQNEFVCGVAYAKRKKPDSMRVMLFQILCLLLIISAIYYIYYHFDHFHTNVTHFYAHQIDDHNAQHVLAHKLLKERNNVTAAFQLFRRSANKGNPHSAYNLVAAHLSGYRTDVQKSEVKHLLKYAADNGVIEAKQLLRGLCRETPSYCYMD